MHWLRAVARLFDRTIGWHRVGFILSVTIIAVVTLLFGATGVFVQLQKTLNMIWDV